MRATFTTLSVACSLLLPAAAGADPAVWLFPALGRLNQVTVSGRVLKESPHGHHALTRNVRSLTADVWEGAPVALALEGQRIKVTSGGEGDFSATFHFEQALSPGIHWVEASVPGAAAKTGVQLLEDTAPFLLISDLDDTISVTNVLHKKELVKAALFEEGETQPAVPGMAGFYRCLMGDKPAAPGIAVVTGTPVQYVPRTLVFLNKNDFPFSGVYPRDLKASTLKGYKQPVIRRLFHELPHKSLCIGDSGEQDPEVYRQMRQEFPDRVLRVYIHDVGRDEDKSRFQDMVLFHDASEAARDAVAQGYMTQGCYDAAFGTPAHP
jgi:phosphatidate phosphatase APP1